MNRESFTPAHLLMKGAAMATTNLNHVSRQWVQHPLTWVPSGIVAAIGILLAIGLGISLLLAGIYGFAGIFAIGVTVFLVLIIIPWNISTFVRGPLTTWTLDDHKINRRYNGMGHSNQELHYWRIAEVEIYQSFWGRRYGYGTIVLTLQGKDGSWVIPNAPNAYALRNYFSAIAAQNKLRQQH